MEVDHGLLWEPTEAQMIDSLLESSEQLPWNILDTEPYPSDLTLAQFSSAVYTEREPWETVAHYGKRLILPEGWGPLALGSNPGATNGYFGAVFVNTKLQQVVVAHRGTALTSSGALFTDVVGIFGTQYTACMNSAITFVDIIRQVILSTNAQHCRKYNLVITGHSLGGWLAQMSVFTVKWLNVDNGALVKNTSGGLHAKAVVFDSPGAKAMLNKIRDTYFVRYTKDILSMLDITVYVVLPNRINTCGEHIGTIYQVFIELFDFDYGSNFLNSVMYNFKTHAISNFVNVFEKNSSNRSQVLDWATNGNEYKSLFEVEGLTKNNNYNLNFERKKEYLDKMIKRYHVVSSGPQPQSFSSHFKALSENEVMLLNKLVIIQKQADVRILNEFISTKNLTIKNDKLFPDFEIDHINQTIICKSKELLGEFIMRLKQLVRWLGTEFVEVVEEQSRTTDIIYRDEGRTYLNTIEKTRLKFTDSIGLRDFLFSETERVFSIVTHGEEEDSKFEMIRLLNLFSQIKESVSVSNLIHKHTTENNYNFLEFTRLQTLYNRYGSPIDQNNLLIVNGSSFSTISSEDSIFLNNFVQCSPPNFKKLVFISSNPINVFNSFEHTQKKIIANQKINLMDLSYESQEIIIQRNSLILTGNTGHSLQEFLGIFKLENCSLNDISQLVSSDCLKRIVTNENYQIILYDTRPPISDLQMPTIKTNIKTSMEHITNCVDLHDSLVVISGLSSEDLGENLAKKIILAKGDVEIIFKDTCNNNQHKTIYLIEVSEKGVYCKQIFNQDFYVPREFRHKAYINLQKFSQTQQLTNSDLFVICSEEHSTSVLELIENRKKREAFSKNNLLVAETEEREVDIIHKYFDKNIHFVKICEKDELSESEYDGSYASDESSDFVDSDESDERGERIEMHQIEWRYSHGSVKSLRSCLSKNSRSIDEVTLSQTVRNLVIITDKPGVGKTTTLANLSRLIKSAWVIYIELKQFRVHIDRLSEKLTPQNVSTFLLSECSSRVQSVDGYLAVRFLEYLLQSKTSVKRVILMFDGFDEMDDYTKNIENSKDKLVKLFTFLQSKPAIQVYLTTRKYLKESLETKLSQFSTSFITMNTKDQRHFLYKFWRSFLPLEQGSDRVEMERLLEEYSGEVLRRNKRVFGPDMSSFMGVPLQLRMTAEVFRPQSDMLVRSLEELFTKCNVDSAPGLYKKFIRLKYEIYLNYKIRLGKALNECEKITYLETFTKQHGELGFRTFFAEFYNSNQQHFEVIPEFRLMTLNRIGLIEAKTNGDFEFIHRTYAEYFCAYMVVRWLNQREIFPQHGSFKEQLIENVVLPQILLHPDSKLIRYFMNYEFDDIVMSDATQSNSERISKLWINNNTIFRNQDHQTALHIAVQERNEHIIKFLLGGLKIENTREAFASFIIQIDGNNHTALHIPDKHPIGFGEDGNLCERIIETMLLSIVTSPDEIRERILFACLLFKDVTKSQVKHSLHKSSKRSGDTLKKVVNRVKTFEINIISSFISALDRNDVQLVKEIFSKRLLNDVERYCLLSMKHQDYGMKTALHRAVQNGNLDVVKVLVQQTNVPFTSLVTRHDEEKKTPLLTAAEYGHLDIFKYLVNHGAEIEINGRLGESTLMFAANYGRVLIVKYLKDNGADIKSTNERGETPQHVAALQGHLPVIEYLVESGADLNSTDNEGETVLHLAAHKGHLQIMEYLVERGINLKSTNNRGETALHAAVWPGHLQVVEYLVKSGADINSTNKYGETAMHAAGREGYLPIIEYLVKNGGHVDSANKHGNTALFEATRGGHLSVAEYLVESGADPNSRDNDGETIIHVAARYGHLSIVNYLVEHFANVNSVNNAGETALHRAAQGGHLQVVECLIESGAELNIANNNGRTAQYVAAQNGHLSIIKYLVENRADINFSHNNGETVLHATARQGHLQIIEYLVESGAELNARDINGRTVLFIAGQKGYLPIIEYYVKSVTNSVNSTDNDGETTLHVAARQGHLSVIKCLVRFGADVHSTNKLCETILHAAVMQGHLPVIEYLINCGAYIYPKGWPELHVAAQLGELPVVKYLLNNNSSSKINCKNDEGKTELHIAAYGGYLPVIEYLVKSGADVISIDNGGKTALHMAAYGGHLPVIEYLVKSGASVISTDNDGKTALHIVAHGGHLPAIKYLLKNGAAINSSHNGGETALHAATHQGHLPTIEYLVKSGANVISVDNDGKTALHIAAHGGHLPVIEYLVKSGANISFIDKAGCTSLHAAARQGHLAIIEYLVKSGAGVTSTDNDGKTALHIAAHGGHLPVIEYLIKSGANISFIDKAGCSALHAAAWQGRLAIVEYLIKTGADVMSIDNDGKTALHIAAHGAHLPVIEYLIKSGANISIIDKAGRTVLHAAAWQGHLAIVEYLIKSGADVISIDNDGKTALHIAAHGGHLPVIDYLIKSSANISFIDKVGRTVLHTAARQGHLAIVEYLIKSGADVIFADKNGKTAFHAAAHGGHLPVIEYLVKSGANISIVDKAGCTALHAAARQGHLAIVEYLVISGADVISADKDGKIAFHIAAHGGHLPVIEYFVKSGANISFVDKAGYTALHAAAWQGHLAIIEYLIENGADVMSVDNDGKTALHIAAQGGHIPVIEYLVNSGAEINMGDNHGRTALCVAAREGHLPIVECLVKIDADVTSTNKYGETALHEAALLGHLPIIEYLVKSGAEINKGDNNGRSALCIATRLGHLPTVECLVKMGADMTSKSLCGDTPLHEAALLEHLSIVEYFIKIGADLDQTDGRGWTALSIVSALRNEVIARVLEEGGADINM